MKTTKILIIEDDGFLVKNLLKKLEDEFTMYFAANYSEAKQLLDTNNIDIALIDIELGEDISGISILKYIQNEYPDTVCIMTTADQTLYTVRECIKIGASCYVKKPYELNELRLQLEVGITIRNKNLSCRLKDEIIRHTQSTIHINMVGNSKAIQKIRFQIRDAADYPSSTVLITGDSGTGKEVVAREIHRCTKNPKRPFIDINCASLPVNLIESELFGHEKGAFTGAIDRKIGCIELANEGDLFLDEISEMPPESQAKLLRVIQEKSFKRIGGSEVIKSDFRLISTSNQDLKKLIANGKFRKDLYYRIYGYQIHIPPLRDRKEDIPLLVNHFIKVMNQKLGKNIEKIEPDLLDRLMQMNWEGNVRALKNLVEYLCIRSSLDTLRLDDLSEFKIDSKETIEELDDLEKIVNFLYEKTLNEGLPRTISSIEKSLIKKSLKEYKNQTQAAALLKISPPNLYAKIQKFGIGKDLVKK